MKARRLPICARATALVGALVTAIPMTVMAQSPAPGLSALTPVGPFLVRFDESGNATISVNGAPATTLAGVLLSDPTQPAGVGQQLALTFMLPEPVVAGDVSFAEVVGSNVPSEWLRFTDSAGHLTGATGQGSRMLFYSDIEAGETGLPADRGFPTNLGSGNFLAQLEVGTEGNNGFDYQPGGVPAPRNNQYIGISDAVPEPETYALILAGLGVLGWVAGNRKKS